MNMTIGTLAREGGVGVETVRFYQRRGLLRMRAGGTGQKPAGIRHYGEDDCRRLRFIRAAQAAGFTLSQIDELLRLDATEDRSRARELAKQQLAVLESKIAELKAARTALSKLARECASGSSGPCPIIAAFEGYDER